MHYANFIMQVMAINGACDLSGLSLLIFTMLLVMVRVVSGVEFVRVVGGIEFVV